MTRIILSGKKYELVKDTQDNQTESEPSYQIDSSEVGISNITQATELGESLKELNQDEIEPTTRMSGIDMRARLHFLEANSILAIDSLVSFGILPLRCLSFTRQKKRLSVSISGKGREEIVKIVGGKQDQDAKKSGFGENIKQYLGGVNN
jgi:hypothetical protein